MDMSVLLRAITADESSLDSIAPWLYVASMVVIIGLVIELRPQPKKLHWRHWDSDLFMEVLGGAVVTVGIAVELCLTFLGSRAEAALRRDNGQYIALLEQQTETLRQQNLTFTTQTETLQQQNLTLIKQIETLRHQNLALKSEFAWRNLTDDQLRSVIIALLKFPGMQFDCEIADAESLNFLVELSRALTAPAIHWVIQSDGESRIQTHTDNGIAIGIFVGTNVTITYNTKDAAELRPAAKALADALVAVGIRAKSAEVPDSNISAENQRIHVRIGSKPAF